MKTYTVLFWLQGVEHEVSKAYVIDHAFATNPHAAIRKIQASRFVYAAAMACVLPPDAMFASDCTWIPLSTRKAVR